VVMMDPDLTLSHAAATQKEENYFKNNERRTTLGEAYHQKAWIIEALADDAGRSLPPEAWTTPLPFYLPFLPSFPHDTPHGGPEGGRTLGRWLRTKPAGGPEPRGPGISTARMQILDRITAIHGDRDWPHSVRHQF
jgi:hypothetical protein